MHIDGSLRQDVGTYACLFPVYHLVKRVTG
jgi:hypothetical protein